MDIDWSKAPSWANAVVSSEACDAGHGIYWVEAWGAHNSPRQQVGKNYRDNELCDMTHIGHSWRLVERRPQASKWDGNGLPPVGITCEYIGRKHGMLEPHPVEIIHHYHGGAAMVAAFLYTRDDQTRVAASIADNFRPILTPDQIATKARQDAIAAMLIDAGITRSAFDGDPEAEVWCAALHDAGYRKIEVSA